jgi:uncharacterized protein YkwD/Flp pilus assembly protein TadD
MVVTAAFAFSAAPLWGTALRVQESEPWRPTEEEVELAGEIIVALNGARTDAGLEALEGQANLDLFAYQHASEMAQRRSVTHHSHLFGIGTRTRVGMAFPDVYQFGENVAANRNATALHRALMASAAHRLNRMDTTFTHVGVGIARAGDHQIYMVEIFVRVFDETPLAEIAVLYSSVSRSSMLEEDPDHGEVVDEIVRIGAPDENNPEYWTQRGIHSYQGNRYAEAVGHFRRSIEIAPDYEYAYYNLARAHLGAGAPAAALAILDRQLARHPEDADMWSSRGTALLLLQRFDEAAEAFRTVLRTRSRDAGSWYNLGLTHEMRGDDDAAERAYGQALHEDPDLAAAAAALARVSH